MLLASLKEYLYYLARYVSSRLCYMREREREVVTGQEDTSKEVIGRILKNGILLKLNERYCCSHEN